MTVKPIDIIIRALGTDQAKEEVGSAAQGMSSDIHRATDAISKDFDEAQARLDALQKALRKDPGNLGLQNATRDAEEFKRKLAETTRELQRTEKAMQQLRAPRLSTRLTGLNTLIEQRDALPDPYAALRSKATSVGIGMTGVGAGGLMLGNHLIQESNADNAASAKLEAMLKKRGEGDQAEGMLSWSKKLAFDAALPDDDPINDATAGLVGFGMEAEKIRGLMPGLIGQSRLYGNSLDSVSEAVGRAFAKGDIDSLARIGVTLSDAQKATMKALEDAGASQAEKQAAMYQILKASFSQYALAMTEGMSDAEIAANRTALAMDDLTTNLGTGAALANNQVKELGVALMNAALPTQALQEGAGYIGEIGSYALTSAGSLLTLVGQIGFAKEGLGLLRGAKVLDTAVTIANTEANVANAASSAAAGTAAAGAATGFAAMGASIAIVVAELLAVAAIAAAVMYALDKLTHFREDRELSENIAAGDAASQKLLDIENAKRAKHGKPALTMEQYQGDPNADDTRNVDLGSAADALTRATAAPPSLVPPSVPPSVPLTATPTLNVAASPQSAPTAASRAAGPNLQQLRAASDADLQSAQAEASKRIGQNQARIALDGEVQRIENLKASGVLDGEEADDQIARLRHAYEVRNAAMQKDALLRKAQVDAQAELAEAQAQASTQAASEAQATLAKAKIKSDAILKKAQIEASVIGSDIAPLAEKQSKFKTLTAFLKNGGSLMRGAGGIGLSSVPLLAGGIGGGAMFNPYAHADYGDAAPFAVSRDDDMRSRYERFLNGENVFTDSFKNRGGSYRPLGQSQPPRVGNRVDQRPNGSYRVTFDTVDIPNPFQQALEGVG